MNRRRARTRIRDSEANRSKLIYVDTRTDVCMIESPKRRQRVLDIRRAKGRNGLEISREKEEIAVARKTFWVV